MALIHFTRHSTDDELESKLAWPAEMALAAGKTARGESERPQVGPSSDLILDV